MAGRIRPGVAEAANDAATYLNHSGNGAGAALLRRVRVERPRIRQGQNARPIPQMPLGDPALRARAVLQT